MCLWGSNCTLVQANCAVAYDTCTCAGRFTPLCHLGSQVLVTLQQHIAALLGWCSFGLFL